MRNACTEMFSIFKMSLMSSLDCYFKSLAFKRICVQERCFCVENVSHELDRWWLFDSSMNCMIDSSEQSVNWLLHLDGSCGGQSSRCCKNPSFAFENLTTRMFAIKKIRVMFLHREFLHLKVELCF